MYDIDGWQTERWRSGSHLAGMEHEKVGEHDERRMVQNTLAVPYRWICSLDINGINGKLSRGSGVFIGPRLVLTAAHNVWGDNRRTSPLSIHVAPARNGRDDPLGRVRAVAYRGDIPASWDLAVLLVERGFEARRHAALGNRPLGYWSRLGSLPAGTPNHFRVAVCGYPGDRCGSIPFDPDDRRDTCAEGDQASTMWIGEGQIMGVNQRTIAHTADTARGQSGSPVWIMVGNEPCVVGIHRSPGARGRDGRYQNNLAAHLNPTVLRTLQAWRK